MFKSLNYLIMGSIGLILGKYMPFTPFAVVMGLILLLWYNNVVATKNGEWD